MRDRRPIETVLSGLKGGIGATASPTGGEDEDEEEQEVDENRRWYDTSEEAI